MDNNIKEIVDNLKIKESKKQLYNDRKLLFLINREISLLTTDIIVGKYAQGFDEYIRLLSLSLDNNDNKNSSELKELLSKLKELEKYSIVQEYIDLNMENISIKNNLNNYYKKVNIDLRNKLIKYGIPNIYVNCGQNNYINIVDSNKKLNNSNDNYYIVDYLYNINSNRDGRHFYNKLSFHYLEQLCNDYTYDLNNKSLGKVLVKKYN